MKKILILLTLMVINVKAASLVFDDSESFVQYKLCTLSSKKCAFKNISKSPALSRSEYLNELFGSNNSSKYICDSKNITTDCLFSLSVSIYKRCTVDKASCGEGESGIGFNNVSSIDNFCSDKRNINNEICKTLSHMTELIDVDSALDVPVVNQDLTKQPAWGCAIVLCLSNPNGWKSVSECRPPVKKLIRWMAKGKHLPSCKGVSYNITRKQFVGCKGSNYTGHGGVISIQWGKNPKTAYAPSYRDGGDILHINDESYYTIGKNDTHCLKGKLILQRSSGGLYAKTPPATGTLGSHYSYSIIRVKQDDGTYLESIFNLKKVPIKNGK